MVSNAKRDPQSRERLLGLSGDFHLKRSFSFKRMLSGFCRFDLLDRNPLCGLCLCPPSQAEIEDFGSVARGSPPTAMAEAVDASEAPMGNPGDIETPAVDDSPPPPATEDASDSHTGGPEVSDINAAMTTKMRQPVDLFVDSDALHELVQSADNPLHPGILSRPSWP